MFAARRALTGAVQTRAFSASARDVSLFHGDQRDISAEPQLLIRCMQMSKVTVLGAAGGIGQPLSLLLKLNPRVTELALYDIRGGPGSEYLHNLRLFTLLKPIPL